MGTASSALYSACEKGDAEVVKHLVEQQPSLLNQSLAMVVSGRREKKEGEKRREQKGEKREKRREEKRRETKLRKV